MKMIKKLFLMAGLFLATGTSVFSQIPWNKIENNFKNLKANKKALSHLRCFFDEFSESSFPLKIPSNAYKNRCYAKESVQLNSPKYAGLIDYTLSSQKPRFYIINLEDGGVRQMGVAHGRFKSGQFRLKVGHQKNSLFWAKYFSNEKGSRAPSSGFFYAGQEYQGDYGRSLILHGLEPKVNDNACERAVVIHSHSMVTNNRANAMSSGCPMVSKKNIDYVVSSLKGKQSGISLKGSGAPIFVYGTREEQWEFGSCPL